MTRLPLLFLVGDLLYEVIKMRLASLESGRSCRAITLPSNFLIHHDSLNLNETLFFVVHLACEKAVFEGFSANPVFWVPFAILEVK